MISEKVSIVFDCGATNVRAVAIDMKGEIRASKSYPNNTRPDPEYPDYRIWDVNEIWDKLCRASKEVMKDLDPESIAGITVTTFGVDGVLFDEGGNILYPMISWQCDRTAPIMADIDKYIPLSKLYSEAAILPFNFNTINKIIWLSENKPDLLKKAYRFLFAPSVFLYFLSGNMANGATMAGTSMMTNKRKRDFSPEILSAIGVERDLFGPLAEPGEKIGQVNKKASLETGLPEGIPVIVTGHDTQFAVFGSGADIDQPVLSSGTWEILMARSASFLSGPEQLSNSITTELDPIEGYFNIGNQWIASGMLEWCSKNFFAELGENLYEDMISGAEKVPPGSKGVRVVTGFYKDSKGAGTGEIKGLTMETTRYEIYRAMLEALALRLHEGKEALEKSGGFKSDTIICVGGGSRNRLWNQLRADIAGVNLKVIDKAETTVLGASLFVWSGCGLASSAEAARSNIEYKSKIYKPSKNAQFYKELFGI